MIKRFLTDLPYRQSIIDKVTDKWTKEYLDFSKYNLKDQNINNLFLSIEGTYRTDIGYNEDYKINGSLDNVEEYDLSVLQHIKPKDLVITDNKERVHDVNKFPVTQQEFKNILFTVIFNVLFMLEEI